MDNMKIAVMIPCYNEAPTIAKVVKDYKAVLPEADVYVYDNNSSDHTDQIAAGVGAIVRYEPKQGKGNVVNTMFREIEADGYLMVDGDDTYDASHAREMMDMVLSGGYDMVIGDRLSGTYFQENDRLFHSFGNVLVRVLIHVLYGGHVNDVMTGLRAFSRSFVKEIPTLSSGFQIETEMTIYALQNKKRIGTVPCIYRNRPENSFSKLNTVRDGVKIIWTILKNKFSGTYRRKRCQT